MIVIVALIGVVAAVSSHYVTSVKNLVRSATTQSIEELTISKVRFIDEKIVSDSECLEMLSVLLSECDDPELAKREAYEFIEAHGASNVLISSTDGATWATNEAALDYVKEERPEIFEDALIGRSGTSSIYVDYRGIRCILFYTPIRQGSTIVGAVYVAFPVASLGSIYAGQGESNYFEEGFSYVVDASGNLILSADKNEFSHAYTNFAEILRKSGNSEEEIDSFMESVGLGQRGEVVFDIDGSPTYVCYAPIHAKEDWTLVCAVPLSVVERDGSEIISLTMQVSFILFVAVLAAGVLISLALIYRYAKNRQNKMHIQDIYQAISSNIDACIFIVDRETNAVDVVFENAKEILGIDAKDFYHKDLTSDNPVYNEISHIIHSRWMEDEGDWEFRSFNTAQDRFMWIRISSTLVYLSEKQKTLYSLTETTSEHIIREGLEQEADIAQAANEAKSTFLSSMSHDIRTPMNAITGFLMLLDQNADDSKLVRSYVQKINSASDHLLDLINEVLDVSKIESGKATLACANFDIVEAVKTAEDLIRPLTEAKSQTFDVVLESLPDHMLIGDEARLRQVLVNLLSNATKYTKEGGAIALRVSCSPKDGDASQSDKTQLLHMEVEDNGIGMSGKYLQTIFDAFTREETEDTAHIQGTGLGMTITKSLVELMGGSISVESELGKGSKFIIELAFEVSDEKASHSTLLASKESSSAAARDEKKQLKDKKILVVEDNELNIEILSSVLSSRGADVILAENGQVAVDKLSASDPFEIDLVFMDIQMPVMDGYDATRAIRSLDREDAESIPIIAMTANAFSEDAMRAKEAGMNAHLSKPIDFKALVKVIEEYTND